MSAPAAAAEFAPWQQRIYAQATEALDAGRLGHALLLAGPQWLGKGAVARRLAHRALCREPVGNLPCGHCRSCQLLDAGTHPDFHMLELVHNKEGTRLRTEIVIDQVRALSSKLALTPQYGGAQVAIVDPADVLNHAACNALLKTLEEPHPGRFLWLVASDPMRLPATIRSRCQRIEFRLPPRAEALAWLAARGHAADPARDALEAARGHPGLADQWLGGGGMALRKSVAADLVASARGEAAIVEIAQRWTSDGNVATRLGHAADLALAQARALTDPLRTRKLALWFDAANRTRELIRSTVRADLAVAELLLAWRQDNASANGANARGSRA